MAGIDVHQWRVFGPSPALTPGQNVTLWNDTYDHSVVYGKRKYGINLKWSRSKSLANAWFEPQPGASSIRPGEPLALAIPGASDGPYVRYRERDNGINLVWSPVPVYEWELVRIPEGQTIGMDVAFSLFNRTYGDHVVYSKRSRGINFMWWSTTQVYWPKRAKSPENLLPYAPLPLPHAMRAPSREPGQIQIGGVASRINLFHGRVDDELDWHIHLRLDPSDQRELAAHLREHSGRKVRIADLNDFYCEWMVLDGWDNSRFDEKFFSADVTDALLLQRSAWEVSVDAANDQGTSQDAPSPLLSSNARVLLQGPLVNDAGHGLQVEIHPLDSFAYAWTPDSRGRPQPLSESTDSPDWPATSLTWRVAAFTNSSFHRINAMTWVSRNRTTTWSLPLPQQAAGGITDVSVNFPGFDNHAHVHSELDDRRRTPAETYTDYGVLNHDYAVRTLTIDGRTEQRLEINITMAAPTDRWGGMFLADYTLTTRPNAAFDVAVDHMLRAT